MFNFSRRNFGRVVLAGAAFSRTARLFAQNDCLSPLLGKSVDFVIPKFPKIERKAIAQLNVSEVARLRLAYQKLRELTVSDPTDPRGWMQQAHVH